MTITIFSRGSFGDLISKLCPKECKVNLLSLRSLDDNKLKEVLTETDILLLAIPFSAYDLSLRRIKPFLKKETLLVDVTSVKILPSKKVTELLPDHKNILITHPLFGPHSSKNGRETEGLSLVICDSEGDLADLVIDYCDNNLKLKLIKMSAEEHDRQMANAQALTFFVSESLSLIDLKNQQLVTPSFEELLDLKELAERESRDLLNLIQQDNPFAEDIRKKFLNATTKLNSNYTKPKLKVEYQ